MWLSGLGWLATGLAIWGVLLNNNRRRGCFLVWMVSNALSAAIHAVVWAHGEPCLALLLRDTTFLVLAVAGWRKWGRTGGGRESRRIDQGEVTRGAADAAVGRCSGM